MDRAQELRSLMKVGAKKEVQMQLSGKDKAKLLKMMKEQNKQKGLNVQPPQGYVIVNPVHHMLHHRLNRDCRQASLILPPSSLLRL